jgi:hypothetical protein
VSPGQVEEKLPNFKDQYISAAFRDVLLLEHEFTTSYLRTSEAVRRKDCAVVIIKMEVEMEK